MVYIAINHVFILYFILLWLCLSVVFTQYGALEIWETPPGLIEKWPEEEDKEPEALS